MVIKSVIVIAIAAICILAAFAVLRYKNPIEEGSFPCTFPKTIQTVLPQSDVKFVDESMILFSRRQTARSDCGRIRYLPTSTRYLVRYFQVTLSLTSETFRHSRDQRVYFHGSILPSPTNAVVNETSRLLVSEDGVEHIKIYKGSIDVVKSWGSKLCYPI
jgi:hypothetical protein